MTWPYTPQELAEWLVGGDGWWRLAWGGMPSGFWCRVRCAGRLKDGGPFVGMIAYRHLGFGIWWRTE